jgi:hypothetical protein
MMASSRLRVVLMSTVRPVWLDVTTTFLPSILSVASNGARLTSAAIFPGEL